MTTPAPYPMQPAGSRFQPAGKWLSQGLSILVFLALGLLVFVVFSHYYPLFEGTADLVGRIVTGVLLLALAWAARRSTRWQAHGLILLAYFTGLAAISLDYYLGLSRWILPALKLSINSPEGLAIDKLESSLLGILAIVVIQRLADQRSDQLYIRRGNLWLGLGIGAAVFLIMSVAVIPITTNFFQGQNLSWGRILPWAPWVLIFIFANASNEELLFRGLFIGKLAPLTGVFGANLVTTIPFVGVHAYTGYASDNFVFLVLQLLPLSLAWCWLMQKTNSLWGSILFHAAMDIPIVVGIFSAL